MEKTKTDITHEKERKKRKNWKEIPSGRKEKADRGRFSIHTLTISCYSICKMLELVMNFTSLSRILYWSATGIDGFWPRAVWTSKWRFCWRKNDCSGTLDWLK